MTGALVTGAGRRIGRALAKTLAARGFDVALHYNASRAEADALAQEINSAGGGRAAPVQADLSREDDTAGLIAKAVGAVGPLSVLVNSAALFEHDDVDTMTAESWNAHLAVNLRAPAKLSQDFAAQIAADKTAAESEDSLIVNIIDQRVLKLTPEFLSYTVSKSALFTLTKVLAQGLGPRGVRVNAIGPGPTLRGARQTEEEWRAQNAATILGRGASPDDIAGALLYFLNARAVTGQMLAVDGGQHLAWETADALADA